MLAGFCYGAAMLLAGLSICAAYLPGGPAGRAWASFTQSGRCLLVVGVGVILLLAASAAVGFGAFYRAHWHGPLAGSVREGDAALLSGFHLMLTLVCFVVAVNMAWRVRWRKTAKWPGLCGLAGIGTAAVAAKAFLLTIPKGGDDSLLLWPLFLMPLLGLAVLILTTLSLFAVIKAIQDRLRSRAFEEKSGVSARPNGS
jgi:hypothetical protein